MDYLWTVARQAPLSMGFPRQEYWSGLPFPSPGDLPDPGIEPGSPSLQADSLLSEPPGKSEKENICKLFLSSDFRYSDGLGRGFYCPHLKAGPQESFDWQVRQWSGLWLPRRHGLCWVQPQGCQFPMGHAGETSAWYEFGWASGWGQGATQQMEAGGGHSLPLAEEGAFRTGSVQSLSQVRLFATPWTAACQASLSITNSQSLLELMSVESVMPSNYIILCCPLLLLPSIFPGTRVFSNESVLCIRWPKYWSFSFSISPSNEYLGLISFRNDWLDLLVVQGTLKSLLQHHSSKASVLWHSAFFMVQFSIHTWLLEKR